MEAPQLNVDVLAIVCEFLTEVSDILSVSLTCSSVHVVAVRWLLLKRPVYLKGRPSIHRFHAFLLADTPARAPYVRDIHIDLMWHRSAADNDVPPILSILTLCQNLEHLTVAFQRASFQTVANPHVLDAIAAIPSLRSFTIRSQSADALPILRQFRAPVGMLGIHSSNLNAVARHPLVLQQSLPRVVVRTLEELELDKLTFDLDGGIQASINFIFPSIFDMAPYPAVRSLFVGTFEGKPLLGRLQHLFPALDGTLRLGGLYVRDGEEQYADIRSENLRSQESDADGVSHTWKKLDRVVCDAPMLYTLGLRCPIRLAMIEFGLVRQHGRYAADALRENPVPQHRLL